MNIYILKIFEIEEDIKNKIKQNKYFKNSISFLSYILLSYIYYKIYKKYLNFNEILKDKNGKPYLKNNEFKFNISHSKNYICIGISKYEIGVDIEEERKINKNAISKFLTEDEIEKNMLSPLEYWVLKEAYSKYLGFGLKMDFKNINAIKLKEDCLKKMLFSYEIINEDFICFCFSNFSLQNIFFISNKEILNYLKKYKRPS